MNLNLHLLKTLIAHDQKRKLNMVGNTNKRPQHYTVMPFVQGTKLLRVLHPSYIQTIILLKYVIIFT